MLLQVPCTNTRSVVTKVLVMDVNLLECDVFYYSHCCLSSFVLENRYIGTITGIGDVDPERWPKSLWRSLKVRFNTLRPFVVLIPP